MSSGSGGGGAGGRLVVMDRLGRDTRAYPLRGGLATLGSDPACDIRVMLSDVAPHHATIAVHTAQTVIRNVSGSATLVNGAAVSVAALRHGDVITLADRRLRWEYDDPTGRRQPRGVSPSVKQLAAAATAGAGVGAGARAGGSRGKRHGSEGAPAPAALALHRDRALHLALEMNHRASMPGSSGGKQVAIVQPQRRDTSEQTGVEQGPKRRSNVTDSPPCAPAPGPAGGAGSGGGSGPVPAHTTQATLWIESRKTSPRRAKSLQGGSPAGAATRMRGRKSTPLRMAVLKRARALRPSLVKIQAPLTIDYTKQAAIMLMTGHTKSKLSKSPSYVVKKPSPVRKTPRNSSRVTSAGSRPSGATGNRSTRSMGNQSETILEITDSSRHSSVRLSSVSTRSSKSPQKSPALPSPKKSALKDTSKKTIRKTESIKFDLSNLENHQESDVVILSENTKNSDSNVSEEDITLHYSDSSAPTHSPSPSPSPRHSIHSRSSRMLEKLGSTVTLSPSRTLTPTSPSSRKSARGSLIVQRALEEGSTLADYTKSEESRVASAFRTRTLSPRKTMESYSIVDLVSLESNDASVYSSADSTNTGEYGTPQTSVRTGRKTRSTIDPTLLGSSTPYLGTARRTRSKSNLTMNVSTRSSVSKRRSKSLTTPENMNVSVESTRVSRRSRSRSRINDSDLFLLDDTELDDASPKTSKRPRSTKSIVSHVSEETTNVEKEGMSTPENRLSPDEVGTPVLSIQTLLDSSRSSLTSQTSSKRGRRLLDLKRKTIGVISEARTRASAARSKANRSLGVSAKKTVLRLSRGSSETSDKTDEGAPQPDNEETATPKSAVKLVPEAVKNKHSTAKKPQSKRSLIDDLDQSDIVKQLFNSPVKRKLSQSMTEFSRKQSFEEVEAVAVAAETRRATRSTTVSGEDSVSDNGAVFTPERFVSPIQTPSNSPNMSGIKRFFEKNTSKKEVMVRDSRSVRRSARPKRSVNNDLTNVSGVKAVFARSPRNRLSDVRVKELFAAAPDDDLRRVSGVRALFRENKSPKNDLTNIRSVKRLFARRSPRNDLRNVSGVKATFGRNTPKNDLTDVRGVRKMFQHEVRGRGRERGRGEETGDMSGIEELFDVSTPSVHDSEALFDRLVGKPVIKAVYSKTMCGKKARSKPRPASLHTSIDVITNNVEEWLEMELQKRLQRGDASKGKVTKELHRLATETVQGEEPIRLCRTRNSSMKKSASETYSAHTLPIKKRSLVEAPSESSKTSLPIKKRAVVHSTPVKGRVNITMNASELGRVSPIAVLDHTKDHAIARSTRTGQMAIAEEKARRASPGAPRRATRATGAPPADRSAKIRRTSLVITKKSPVMSPKAGPAAALEADASNLTKTRSSRAKNEKTIETPKKTRTRARKATVVVSKPSPQVRARRPRPPASPPAPAPPPPPETRTRRTRRVQIESPKRSQKGKKTTEPKTEERPAPKRTRNPTAPAERPTAAPEEAPKRNRRGKPDQTTAIPEDKSTRRSKRVETVISVEVSNARKRGRPKARADIEVPAVEIEPVTRPRARRTRPVEGSTEAQPARATRARAVAAVSHVIDTDTDTNTETKGNKTVRGRRKVEVIESPAGGGRATRATRAGKRVTAPHGEGPPTDGAGDGAGAGDGRRKRKRDASTAIEPRKKASAAVSSPVKRRRAAPAPLAAPESVAPAPRTRAARGRRR